MAKKADSPLSAYVPGDKECPFWVTSNTTEQKKARFVVLDGSEATRLRERGRSEDGPVAKGTCFRGDSIARAVNTGTPNNGQLGQIKEQHLQTDNIALNFMFVRLCYGVLTVVDLWFRLLSIRVRY